MDLSWLYPALPVVFFVSVDLTIMNYLDKAGVSGVALEVAFFSCCLSTLSLLVFFWFKTHDEVSAALSLAVLFLWVFRPIGKSKINKYLPLR